MTSPPKTVERPETTAPGILFVGPGPERSPLAGTPRVIHVPTIYDAIGTIAAAPSRCRFRAMIVHAALLDQVSDRALRCLRELDQNLTLVLFRDHEQRGGNRTDDFDRVLDAPLDPDRLEALLEPERVAADSPADRRRGESADRAARDDREDREDRGRGQSGSEPHDATARPSGPPRPHGDPLDLPEWPAAAQSSGAADPTPIDAAGAPSPAPDEDDEPSTTTEPLGDTDLVRAVMEEPGGVRETAVALLREQTGWSSLELVDPPMDDGRGAVVEADGFVFGELRADEAAPEELAPWAEWLAYWLELDRTYADFRHKAYHDSLTGAWNRRYFVDFLEGAIAEASRRRRPITLMVFDIDDFKHYNDQFGHAAGDEILRETVRLLNSVIRSEDRVCRIGGDEFAVIFADLERPRTPGSEPPNTVDQIARRFQEQICAMRFPKLGIEAPGTLSISAGLASYPWDGDDPIRLLRHADELALQSKNSGKNAITLGPGAQRICGRPRREA